MAVYISQLVVGSKTPWIQDPDLNTFLQLGCGGEIQFFTVEDRYQNFNPEGIDRIFRY